MAAQGTALMRKHSGKRMHVRIQHFRGMHQMKVAARAGTSSQESGQRNSRRIVFSAGDSRERTEPLQPLILKLRAEMPGLEMAMLGNEGEEQFARSFNVTFSDIGAPKVSKPILRWRNARCLLRLLRATWRAIGFLRKFRPQAVVGFAGNVSVAVCMAAAILRIPVALCEPNAAQGASTATIARIAAVVVAPLKCLQGLKVKEGAEIVQGCPLGDEVAKGQEKLTARKAIFGHKLEARARVVALICARRGSRQLNWAIEYALEHLVAEKNWYVVWQTGREGDEFGTDDSGRVAKKGFFDRLDLVYFASDLVFAAPEAITCAELLAAGCPSILLPLKGCPSQEANARAMESLGASVIVSEDSAMNGDVPFHLLSLMRSMRMLQAMAGAAKHAAASDCTDAFVRKIADMCGWPHARKSLPDSSQGIRKAVEGIVGITARDYDPA